MGQWSLLPNDLLLTIEELLEYIDKVRIRAVCASWTSLLPNMHQVNRFPLLLRAFNDNNNSNATHGFFDIFEKKFYNFNLSELQGKMFKGSSHGWILTVQDIPNDYSPTKSSIINTTDMFMINPFTGVRIQLPPINTLPFIEEFVPDREEEYSLRHRDKDLTDGGDIPYFSSDEVNRIFTSKLVLSTSNPSIGENCLVVAICGIYRELACCNCNDDKWKPLKRPPHTRAPFEDVIFSKGKLYAVNCAAELYVYESIYSEPIQLVQRSRVFFTPLYLVEGSAGWLLVQRRYACFGSDGKVCSPEFEDLSYEHSRLTVYFNVFKLDLNGSTWTEVKNIGDDILFVGMCASFSISAREFPGVKGNRIYFADSEYSYEQAKFFDTTTEAGVFDIEDGTVEPLSGFVSEVKLLRPTPLWIIRPNSS